MPVSPFFKEAKQTLIASAQQSLTTVTAYPPVQQGIQGYRQFFNAINLWDAPFTKNILNLSLQANLIHYVLPILAYRRAITAAKKITHSNTADTVIDMVDFAITSTLILRLYARRLVDNTFYTASLTRALNTDYKPYLQQQLKTLATSSAESVMLLLQMFLKEAGTATALQIHCQLEFEKIFSDFFTLKTPLLTDINRLITTIEKMLQQLPAHFFDKKWNAMLQYYSVNKPVAELLGYGIGLQYAPALEENFAQASRSLDQFYQNIANDLSVDNPVITVKQLLLTQFATLKTALPMKTLPPCGCEIKAVIQANLSSPLYYAANQCYTAIPDVLHDYGWLSDEKYYIAKVIAVLATIVFYGTCFNEYKAAPEDNCIDHRYKILARNKAHTFGMGLAFYLSLQLLTFTTQHALGVESYFIKDAYTNLLMQFGVVSMLAFNAPLPGQKPNAWDLLYPLRVTSAKLFRMCKPQMEETQSRNTVIAKIFGVLSSEELRYGTDVLLSAGDYFPRRELLSWGAWQRQRNITYDPRRVLCDYAAFMVFFDLHKDDIKYAIAKINDAHYLSTWIARPLLAFFPMSGMTGLIVNIMQIMKDECLSDVIKRNKLNEFFLYYRKQLAQDEASIRVSSSDDLAVLTTPSGTSGKLALTLSPDHFAEPYQENTNHMECPETDELYHNRKLAQACQSEEDDDFLHVVLPPKAKKSSLAKLGLMAVKKASNVLVQSSELYKHHESNAVVRYKLP